MGLGVEEPDEDRHPAKEEVAEEGAGAPGPAEVEMIRSAMGPRDAALVSVLAYAGLRPGEALALT